MGKIEVKGEMQTLNTGERVTVKVLRDLRFILADLNKHVAVIIGKQIPPISASRKQWNNVSKLKLVKFKSGKRHKF